MTTIEESFDEIFSEAVEEAFSSLGDFAKQAVYWYVVNKPDLQKEHLASNIEAFAASLEAFLGSGSSVMERIILQRLSSRTGVAIGQEERARFVDAVNLIREKVTASGSHTRAS
jgi:hypothetical protein